MASIVEHPDIRSTGSAPLPGEPNDRFYRFVRERVNPGAQERDVRGEECPSHLLRETAEIGLFGYALPAEVGGAGADLHDWGLLLERLGHVCEDASFPALLSARVWVTDTLRATASTDATRRLVERMANAEVFGSFAYSDGADPFTFTSTVRRDGSMFVVNGSKPIVTGAMSADVFLVFLNDEATGDLAVLLLERSDPGLTIEPLDAMGMRGIGLGSLHMRDVRVPLERLIIGADGLTYAQRMLNARRVLLGAPVVGAMRALHEHCVEQLSETFRYGVPLIEMQNVQAALGRQAIAVESARAILHRALLLLSGHEPGFDDVFDPLISAAKHEITTKAIDVGISALRLLGGRGYLRGRAERFVRDACGLLAAGGAQDVLELDLGLLAATARDRSER